MDFLRRSRLQLRRVLHGSGRFCTRRGAPDGPARHPGARKVPADAAAARRRREPDLLPGLHEAGLHARQRPLGRGHRDRGGDAPDLRRDRPDPERLRVLGLLRGDPRPPVPLPGFLVVAGFPEDRLLPLRQQPRADVSDLFPGRPGRFASADPLPEGGGAEPGGPHRHRRPRESVPHRLGGLRRARGPVLRHPVLGPGQRRVLHRP